jgi:predicted transcriptional regulator
VTIRVDPELKKRMSEVNEDWSAYLRDAIMRRLEMEDRRKAARRLLEDKKAGKRRVPPGFIEKVLREARDAQEGSLSLA